MGDRKNIQQSVLPIPSFFLKAEAISELNSTSLFGVCRLDSDRLEISLSEAKNFQLNRNTQEVSFYDEDEALVVDFFAGILASGKNLENQGVNIFFRAVKKFIEGVEETTEMYLATKNKIYIEKEEDVELSKENLLKTSVFPGFSMDKKIETELSVLDCIFVKFKTGEVFKYGDLLHHPWFILLPWAVCESPLNDELFLWRKQALRPDAGVYEQEDALVSKLLYSLPDLVDQNKVKVFLVEKPFDDRGYSLAYTGIFKVSPEIEKVHIKPVLFDSANLKLVDRALSLELDYNIDLSKARMMDSLFHLKESAELFITKEDEIREKIKDLFSADKLRFKLKSLSFEVSEDSLKSKVSYSDSFYQKPTQMIKDLEALFPIKIKHDLNLKVVDPGRLNLIFSNMNPSKVELKYPDLSVDPTSYLMRRILKVLLGLKGGVAGYLGKDAANIAVKGNKRLAELKLLKSSGFFSFLIMELIQASKKEAELDFESLWVKLDKLILRLSYSESETTDDVVSSFFVDYVNQCIHDLFDRENYEVLQVLSSQVVMMSSQKNVFDFIEPLLANLLSYYKGKTFVLDKFQDFEINPKQSVKEGLSLILQSPCPLKLGNFIEYNDCILNEETVKIMKKDSFKAELKIVDSDAGSSNKKIDWFELDPKYYFDGVEISEAEAKSFRSNSIVRHNGQVFFIPEKDIPVVKWLNYFWDRLSLDKKNSVKDEDSESDAPAFYRSHILDILALRQSGIPVEGGERWQEIAKEYDAIEEDTSLSLDGFDGNLKTFQSRGVSWLTQLYRIGLGGILADDMGLGKTVQVLAFLNHLKNHEAKRLHLIVVPTSLIHNWRSETERFTPGAEIFTYKSGLQKELEDLEEGIVLVTYGLLTEHQELFQNKDWDVIIFDEAQQLKNIKSMRSQAARNIKAKAKICLTGTPMENHYGEFFSLIDLSVPGALGDHSSFMKIYGPRKVSTGAVGKKEIDYLKLKSKPLVLRRTKDEVLKELPDKTESIVKIDFDEKQREIYKNVALSWNSKVQKLLVDQGESKSQIQMFAALMKLRQVCSCPDIVVGTEYNKLSPKLSLVVERAEELLSAGKSVLIFTNFISTLDNIKKELKKRDLNVLSITGKDSQKKREATLNEFNEEGNKALVMTLKTGGVGLNLTKANYIIHVEPWWNPAAENQGTDRAHRIGQKQPVHVYRYIMNNSIEEKIQTLKEAKQEAFNLLLMETADGDIDSASFKGGSGLTKKDFEYLLS